MNNSRVLQQVMKIHGNFLLNIDDFMDSSVLDFVSGIVPPEAIGHDHEPENQQVLTQVIEPNKQTLPKQPLLPLKRTSLYISKRVRESVPLEH